ncbi:MAG: hypothetical protein ACYDBP_06615 [Leptospirales bacterium]
MARPRRLHKAKMNLEVPALRRVGNLIYKESVEGVSICVYSYGFARKHAKAQRQSGIDYTLNLRPVPIEVAADNPTADKLREYFDLDEIIDEKARKQEIAQKEGLGAAEREKLEEELERAIFFADQRKQNWDKIINPIQLKRLALFANYVIEDRKLREEYNSLEEIKSKPKPGRDAQIAFFQSTYGLSKEAAEKMVDDLNKKAEEKTQKKK